MGGAGADCTCKPGEKRQPCEVDGVEIGCCQPGKVSGKKPPRRDSVTEGASDKTHADGEGSESERDADDHAEGVSDKPHADSDGDGHKNENDDFPKDKKEWKDSDDDGTGDNLDAYPHDPDCKDQDDCPEAQPGTADAHGWDPIAIDKVEKPLPPQGYNEYARGPRVEHDDQETYTGDWRKEWPTVDETEEESIRRICEKNPANDWCKRYQRYREFAR